MKKTAWVVPIAILATPSLVLANTSTKAPLPTEAPGTGALFGTVTVMIVVIGVAWIGLRFFLKKFKVTQKGNIDVVAVRQIAPNRMIEVVKVYGKHYVVGVGDTITVLDELTDEEVEVHGESRSEIEINFPKMLSERLNVLRARYKKTSGEKE